MYARLFQFNLGPGSWDESAKLADQFAPIFSTLEGLKSVTFFGDADSGEYGTFSLWETEEAAEASRQALGEVFQEAVGNKLKGPPTVKTMEVYEPRT